MRTILINSLVYNRVILKKLREFYNLKEIEIEILAIIDSQINKKNQIEAFCSVPAVRLSIPESWTDLVLYSAIKRLIKEGYIKDIGTDKKSYKLVLTGQGDYILREYSKLIHQKIREANGTKSKRLKYSFINGIE